VLLFLPDVGVYDYVKRPPRWDIFQHEASVVTSRPNPGSRNTTLISVVIVVAVLYFARVVLIPLALAVLFAFLLGPLVMWLRHRGIGRLPAVLIVVHLAFAVIAALGFLLAVQLTELGHKMPEYEQNIHNKLISIRNSSSGVIGRFSRFMHDFNQELSAPAANVKPGPGDQKPVPVEIQHGPFSSLEMAPKVLGSLAGLLLTAIIVIVFVIFMLLQQEDLRDRVIRLAGAGRLNVTTKALDETGERVSRYLVAQLIVNVAFGIPAGVALYFLGVPNPILWGMLAALFRYIPYLGIWIAAVMPAAVLFAIDPSWVKPFLVFGIYFGIDLLMYNFVEPWVYGNSTGMTPLAILVAAVFWTWLWGAVGLLLATPLTVCFAVLGRHVPSLRFLGVLLSDEPGLSPEKRFYQRLLATDVEEAAGVAEEFLKQNSLEKLYDTVIIPALSLAEEDRRAGRLDEEEGQAVFHDARLIIEDLWPRSQEIGSDGSNDRDDEGETAPGSRELNGTQVLLLPARSEVDEIAALMLAQLMEARGVRTKVMSASALASEQLQEVAREKIRLVCIATVRPEGHLHARYLCKRLREQFPDMKIVTAILAGGEGREIKQRELLPSADEVATTLAETVTGLCALLPVSAHSEQKAFRS
jgi:predicted PurR-regulated permease PerM